MGFVIYLFIFCQICPKSTNGSSWDQLSAAETQRRGGLET